MQLPYTYRVTKYDPADRDDHGHYTGAEDTVSDHGIQEAAYLGAVEAFAAEAGIDRLSVREPQVPSLGLGALPPAGADGLDGLLDLLDLHDGAEVPLAVGLELTRLMLRESGVWCRLEWEGVFAVHVGWDQYLYVGSDRPVEEALARTRALGLFPERLEASPYAMRIDDEGTARPGDDDFWATVSWAVATGRAGLLEEAYVEGATRWHRLTHRTVDEVRSRIAPRARLAVWPGLSWDTAAVLDSLPEDGLVEGVWQDEDGLIHSAVVDETGFEQLADLMSGAEGAALLSVYADERVPLFTAVVPDSDGVIRARWRTDTAPGDRTYAFLKTLRRGDVISGTVAHVADFGVTFVDIGGNDEGDGTDGNAGIADGSRGTGSPDSPGFKAIINIPELSWRHLDHPSEAVSVGQQIRAEILDVDLTRERVSLSLKALHEDPMPQLRALIGRTVVGPVTKVVPFGVFVRIEERADGFEGLVHNSELEEAPSDGPRPGIEVGDTLRVKILDVDPTRRRITLSQREAVPEA
ncbi:S1 RNA-binding domain-containing protein [Streptomyces atriruber]|uniref:S1 RNA-binding domain-containing protein n=1 Tax=Streptomyces atriruber TaxID=545121 RepID=UPI0006E29548|nr:S1 RNA-binding domain-containing protein [Streptomyces atriruber]